MSSLATQLFFLGFFSAALGISSFYLLRSRLNGGVNLILAVLWGSLAAIFWDHGSEIFLERTATGFHFAPLLALAGGVVIYLIFSKLFHSHSHKDLLRASSILPHSALDGALWGLSVGFSPGFSSAVLPFIFVHRGLEVTSWMGLFRELKPSRALGLLAMMILSFSFSALFVGQLLSMQDPVRDKVMIFYLVSLGYLVTPMLRELLEHLQDLNSFWRYLWALSSVVGFWLAHHLAH